MFIVGEYIQKRDEELLATVLTCEQIDDTTTIYRVAVEGALGYDKYVFATEYTWKPYVPHAHITRRSRDCDGAYALELVEMPRDEERLSIFGDIQFKQRVISESINITGFGGTLEIDEDTSFTWYEKTEEGHVRVDGEWCYDCDKTNKPSRFRDFTAEAAGY